jgi:hypothetical protein
MTGDHHGRTARRATLLVRAADEILGTHSIVTPLAVCMTCAWTLSVDSRAGDHIMYACP